MLAGPCTSRELSEYGVLRRIKDSSVCGPDTFDKTRGAASTVGGVAPRSSSLEA